ncbi:MAG: Rieske 2Fe-2S domain-containing protein [Nevskia sp.]|nr:Rieske 2Fe-2S domain-containing protein [Nevskia sp.]
MDRVKLADSAEVREGAVHAVKAEGRSILLSRVGGKVCAVENRCPHFGLPLARGKVADGTIRCPFHGSRFDLCSGENLDWVKSVGGLPLPEWSRGLVALGKQPTPLRRFEVNEENGAVFLQQP